MRSLAPFRTRDRKRFAVAITYLAALFLLGVGTISRAEDTHDEESASPDSTFDDALPEETPSPRPRGPTAPIVERIGDPAEQPRDAQGRLTAPPIFQTASVLFRNRISPPVPPPLPPAPKRDIASTGPGPLDEIPTYAGAPPSPGTGYIGDFSTDPAIAGTTDGQKTSQSEATQANTYVKIRSAIGGNVETDPVASDGKTKDPTVSSTDKRRPTPKPTPARLTPQLGAISPE